MTDEEIKKNSNRSKNIVPMIRQQGTCRMTSPRGLSKGNSRAKELIQAISDYLPILRGMNSVILGSSLTVRKEQQLDTDTRQRFHLIRIESIEMKEILENLMTKLENLKSLTGLPPY